MKTALHRILAVIAACVLTGVLVYSTRPAPLEQAARAAYRAAHNVDVLVIPNALAHRLHAITKPAARRSGSNRPLVIVARDAKRHRRALRGLRVQWLRAP